MALYSYVGLDGTPSIIDDKNIRFRGTWVNSTPYLVHDSVTYNGRKFIAVVNNTGVTPPNNLSNVKPTTWSSLILVESTAPINIVEADAQAAYSVAILALDTAWNGTQAAAAAQATADMAHATGTNAEADAQSAYGVAVDALQTAWAGTDATQAVSTIASNAQTTANSAFGLAGAANTTATTANSKANTALGILGPAIHGNVSFWLKTDQGGPIDTQISFIDGVLTAKTTNDASLTDLFENLSFTRFINVVVTPADTGQQVGTFVVNLLDSQSWAPNGNSAVYNRIGDQSSGATDSISIVDDQGRVAAQWDISGGVLDTLGGVKFLNTGASHLWSAGTYYVKNGSGAPISDSIVVSMRLEGLCFIGGGSPA